MVSTLQYKDLVVWKTLPSVADLHHIVICIILLCIIEMKSLKLCNGI